MDGQERTDKRRIFVRPIRGRWLMITLVNPVTADSLRESRPKFDARPMHRMLAH